MINISLHKNKSGFTLVETLVAITILMIAIAGPLTVATKAYTAALDAKNQIIGTFLAQELMEDLHNWKDNDTNSNFPSQLTDNCVSGKKCNLEVSGTDLGYSLTMADCIGLCSLYLNPDLGYVYDSNVGVKTIFSRYFTVSNASASAALITVVVSWNTGSVSNQVQFQQYMTNKTI